MAKSKHPPPGGGGGGGGGGGRRCSDGPSGAERESVRWFRTHRVRRAPAGVLTFAVSWLTRLLIDSRAREASYDGDVSLVSPSLSNLSARPCGSVRVSRTRTTPSRGPANDSIAGRRVDAEMDERDARLFGGVERRARPAVCRKVLNRATTALFSFPPDDVTDCFIPERFSIRYPSTSGHQGACMN